MTVIAICYNHAAWLPSSLSSILSQRSAADRIVFCDDGSTDGSRELAASILADDPRVVPLRNMHVNKGLIARLSEALSLCGDDYVILAPCDDLLHRDAIAIHREQIERTRTRWSIGAVQIVDEDDSPLRLCDPVTALEEAGGDILRAAMNYGFEVHGWCFAASLYREVGGLRLDIPLEDYQLAIKFPHATLPACSSQIVAFYRRRASSMSTGLMSGGLLRDAGWLALTQLKYRPVFSLQRASDFFYAAAMHHAAHSQYEQALISALLSAAAWPSPRRLSQQVVNGVSRALRKLRAS